MTLSSLNYKTLVVVLKDLAGGSIGFDPYRDDRTKKKEGLLAYVAANFQDDAIIAAVKRLDVAKASDAPPVEASPKAEAAKTAKAKPVESVADPALVGQQIATLLASLTAKSALDEDRVKTMIGAELFEYESTMRSIVDAQIAGFIMPTRVEIKKQATAEIKDLGVQHVRFPVLLKACTARTPDGHRLNIWLKGPAGSGKTTGAKKAAEALELPFHFNGAIDTQYALMGFVDAGGTYHRTAFREAFEHGGVYLFDEVDSSSPSAVLAFNAALANGVCCFPDGVVKRHADCVVVAGANTTGNGATSEYVGRFKQDASFLDRFVVIDWPIDEALELAIGGDRSWTKRVQGIRARIEKRAIKNQLVTPRASVYGAALLAAGLEQETVEAMVLRKGLAQDAWEQVS